MGIFEVPAFAEGTDRMIDLLASLTTSGVITVPCGGHTLAAIENKGNVTFTHMSVGGGATLAYLASGLQLPGLAVLDDASEASEKATPTPAPPMRESQSQSQSQSQSGSSETKKQKVEDGKSSGEAAIESKQEQS
jgi:hypothetical protein